MPMLASKGARAMRNGEYANIRATTTVSGATSFFISSTTEVDTKDTEDTKEEQSLSPLCPLCPSCPRYSVINGSNVHSANVTNTTSNAIRIDNHMIAVGWSRGDAVKAAVPRTPAMITGI